MIHKKLLSLLKLRNKAMLATDKTVCIKGGDVIQTDLLTEIRIKGVCPQIPDGIYELDGFKLGVLNKLLDVSEYPDNFKEVKNPQDFYINSDSLKRFSEFCGADIWRPAFEYVVFKNGNMYASDAHKLIRRKDVSPPKVVCGIKKDVIKLIPQKTEVQIFASNDFNSSLNFFYEGVVIEINFVNFVGTFLDYDAVIPDKDKRSDKFKVSGDIDWAKLSYAANKITKKVVFKNADSDFIILSQDVYDNKEFIQKNVITESTNNPFELSLNIDSLETCVGKSKTFEVRFDRDQLGRPLNILTDSGDDIVLMAIYQN